MGLNLDRSTREERPYTFDGVARGCELRQETDKNGELLFFHDDCDYDRDQPYGGRYGCGDDTGCQKDEPRISLHWKVMRDDERKTPWSEDGCDEWKVPYTRKPRGKEFEAEPTKGSVFDQEQAKMDEEFERLNTAPITKEEDFGLVVNQRVRFESKKVGSRYYNRFVEILA